MYIHLCLCVCYIICVRYSLYICSIHYTCKGLTKAVFDIGIPILGLGIPKFNPYQK